MRGWGQHTGVIYGSRIKKVRKQLVLITSLFESRQRWYDGSSHELCGVDAKGKIGNRVGYADRAPSEMALYSKR